MLPSHCKFGVVGDLMLGDQPLLMGLGLRSHCRDNYTDLLAPLIPLARELCFVVANLECTIIDSAQQGDIAPAAMQAPDTALRSLYEANIRILSVANNHSMEYGLQPFLRTIKLCARQGLTVFGTLAQPYVILNCNGIQVGVLGFSTIPAFYGIETGYVFCDPSSKDSIQQLSNLAVEASKNSDYLMAYPHWGSEFVNVPGQEQVFLAETLLACGVDIICGSHPHVVQTAAKLARRPVFFSLGNLLTDYWQEPEKTGLLVTVCPRNSCTGSVQIMRCDHEFIVRPTGPPISIQRYLQCRFVVTAPREFARLVRHARMRYRKETLKLLCHNWRHVLKHPRILSWVFRRIFYIIRTLNRTQKDRKTLYSGPMH